MTLQWRLVITVAMGTLHLIGKFFSAKSIMFLTVLACPPTSLVLGLFFLMGLFAVTVWNAIGVFTMWRTHRTKALIPIAVCLPFFLLGGLAGTLGLNARIETFKHDLPEFQTKAEAVVRELQDRAESATVRNKQSNYFGRHAGFNIYAEADTNGIPTVRFVRVVTINLHHRGYMYRPDGNLKSALREREWIQTSINEKWGAIGD